MTGHRMAEGSLITRTAHPASGGLRAKQSETGWILAQPEQRVARLVEPPSRSMVWLACWDCKASDEAN